MYIVKISAKDENGEYQYIDFEVKCNSEILAVHQAVNYYYSKYWSNSDWQKDEFEKDKNNFKNKINELFNSSSLKNHSLKIFLLNEFQEKYESYLRSYLGATDKSVEEFSKISLQNKIQYLSEIGCELSYFVYPKKTKFEKILI